ncbi:hypothetical protein EAE96_009709 [Botrytis aclada]|nr:hypothetical protein EAE96_009709 [Botrytis aclada]
MLPPRLNPTLLTSGLKRTLPRHHSWIPALLNHHAGLTIARRGRCWSLRNANANTNAGIDIDGVRHASSSSSSSSTRWKSRQGKDAFAREAKVRGLRSRAAFKLLEIDKKYKIFKKGQTVVDLGYAPGSWSQVAYERTQPHGRILGIDIIPAQPPQGVSTIQGNFLSRRVQQSVKNFLLDPERGRPRRPLFSSSSSASEENDENDENVEDPEDLDIAASEPSYIDLERHMDMDDDAAQTQTHHPTSSAPLPAQEQEQEQDTTKMVHVVLSDMMMNTTGIKFSDHAGSMDLCNAALQFAFDTLRPGGHFVCKFYQGAEDKELESKLKKMFAVVHREKPESSRSESKEAYFVALRRNGYNDAASLGYVNDV